MPRPFLLYGDSPALPSGLGRILRDLASRLYLQEEALGIRLATVGVSEPTGVDWQAWPHFRFQPTWTDQGEIEVGRAIQLLRQEGAEGDPIVLVIFDPSRSFALLEARAKEILPLDTEIWGYFPIDGHPACVDLGGPAGSMIREADRVLAYGRYGSEVLRRTRGRSVSYLPHGIEPQVWQATEDHGGDPAFWAWVSTLQPETLLVGVVATNQPRKDYGMVFEVIRPLEEALRRPVALWVHSDFFTKVWDFGELTRINHLAQGSVFVSVAGGNAQGEALMDKDLANRYAASSLTLAPGLGEGFGYPICESLLCGTPVVHVGYAGGVELLPTPHALIPPLALRAEGIYGVQRPVLEAGSVVEACLRVIEAGVHPALLQGAAGWYSWEHVWPAWEQWIRKGLVQA